MSNIKTDLADKWFSKYIRLRDGKCMRCGSIVQYNASGEPTSHQNSHYIGRRKESTRFDLDNCITLCYGCHQYWHENPKEYDKWMIDHKGQKVVDDLILRSNMYKKKDRKMEVLTWKEAFFNLLDEKR